MKKTLIVVAHPDMDSSVVNKRWVDELKKYPAKLTVHELYREYPEGRIDVAREQALIESHDHLILQFPMYWFSSPPRLKQWLDDVFTYGWAYGSTGTKLRNKKIGLAVTVGGSQESYADQFTLKNILTPFEVTMYYVSADYQPAFALYGANPHPKQEDSATPETIHQSARDYAHYVLNL